MKCKYLFQGLFIALVALLSFSGVQAQNVITMTTDKNVGDVIILFIETIGHNDVVQIDGVEGTYKQYQRSYKLTSPTVKITGNIKKT